MMREKIARLIQNKRKEKGWTQKNYQRVFVPKLSSVKLKKQKLVHQSNYLMLWLKS